jgi:hypothetical protein
LTDELFFAGSETHTNKYAMKAMVISAASFFTADGTAICSFLTLALGRIVGSISWLG